MSYGTEGTTSIAVGSVMSDAVKTNELTAVGLVVSGSNITGTAVTFLGSVDGTNYYSLYDDTSTEVSLTVTSASRCYNLDPKIFYPWDYLKVRLGTTASPVAQTTRAINFQFKFRRI